MVVWDGEGEARCVWRGLRVGTSSHEARNLGLFATLDFCRGSKIPYYGVRLTREEYDAQDDQTYCVGIHPDERDGKRPVVDGNPSWYERWTPQSGHPVFAPNTSNQYRRLPSDLMIGSYVNEPVPGETLNLKLVGTSRRAYFLMTRDVKAGEELLSLYGEEYARDYPSPYEWYDQNHLAEWRAFWN